MTAMRVAQNGPDQVVAGNNQNIASSYQTATPQQLQAAGIQPVVINDRPNAVTPRMRTARPGPANLPTNPPYNNFPNNGMNNTMNPEYGSFNNRSIPSNSSVNNFPTGPGTQYPANRNMSMNTNPSNPSLSSYQQQLLPQRNGPNNTNGHLQVR